MTTLFGGFSESKDNTTLNHQIFSQGGTGRLRRERVKAKFYIYR